MSWNHIGRPGRRWRNWSRNLEAFPERIFHPETLDDVVAIIRSARAEKKRIRFAGDSHSWSPLVPTQDYLVFTKKLKGIEADLSDPSHPRLTVGPGTTIAEFNEVCRKHGLVLPANVVPTDFHIAAVAAAGCHGTGRLEPTVPDFVEAIEIVDSDGRVRRFTEKEHGVEVMNAARLSLGMFGFIWRMTFRVVPAFNVHVVEDTTPDMVSTIPRFGDIVDAHDYTELVWWPFNKTMWVMTYDRTGEKPTWSGLRHWCNEQVQKAKLRAGALTYRFMMLLPGLTPLLMRIMYRISVSDIDAIWPAGWAIHYQAGLKIVRATNAEVAFPITHGFAGVERAWRVVVDKTKEYSARGSYPFNMVLVARFVRGSRIPHSPAYGDGTFCFIEIQTYADTKDWVAFSTDVMADWLKIPNARPHWAKEVRQFRPMAMRVAYGDHLRRFIEIRDSLGIDSGNMFVNDYLSEVFFPDEASRMSDRPSGGPHRSLMSNVYRKTFGKAGALAYLGEAGAHIAVLFTGFRLTDLPFAADWFFALFGSYCGIGLLIFARNIDAKGKWGKVAYCLTTAHIWVSVVLHGYIILVRSHAFLDIFSQRYSYLGLAYCIFFVAWLWMVRLRQWPNSYQ